MEKIITHEGASWKIVGRGIQNDGKTLCHLASTTEFRVQKNGKVPRQIIDWIDTNLVEA